MRTSRMRKAPPAHARKAERRHMPAAGIRKRGPHDPRGSAARPGSEAVRVMPAPTHEPAAYPLARPCVLGACPCGWAPFFYPTAPVPIAPNRRAVIGNGWYGHGTGA